MRIKFALFAEVMLTGVLVAVASVGVVTAVPAAVAGAAHLGRHIDDVGGTAATVAHDFVTALRRLWAVSLGLVALELLLAFNVLVCLSQPVAGGPAVAGLCAGLALAALLVVGRLVGRWSVLLDEPALPALRDAARLTVADPVGTALLAGAAAAVAGACSMQYILWLLAPGPLVFASVAVELRRLHWRTVEERP